MKLLMLFTWLFFTSSSYASTRIPPAPGQLYDIGSHRIHLYCLGEGSPTVLIDAGLGDDSSDWQTVQQAASTQTKVCVYDRAGYGWSDVGPRPRNSAVIAEELHRLIKVSHLTGSLVLVGHSFGGYNIRIFAANHPEKVAGLIFVDASHENQYERLDIRLPRYYHRQSNLLIMPKSSTKTHSDKAVALRERAIHAARLEITSLYQSSLQVKQLRSTPRVPLIVITRGQQQWYSNADAVKKEKVWISLQQDLWRLSPISQHIFAHSSGHDIHIDQPDVIVKAISDIVDRSRIALN